MDGLIAYKNTTSQIKDVDVKKGIVTGYLSDFGSKDYDGDIIVKGAYSKSIKERKDQIFFLNQHDWKQPHGKFNVLEEDTKGLYFESNPLINTSYSKDALLLYEAGIVKEHSVAFITIKQGYSKNDDANIMKELKLLEGSNVTLGANPNTPFTGFKSMTITETNDQVNRILKMLKNGTLTDDTFILLEVALKQLQKQAFTLGKNSLKDVKPSDDTSNDNKPKANAVDIINKFTNTL